MVSWQAHDMRDENQEDALEARHGSDPVGHLHGVGSADEMADILEDVERLGGALAELPHQLSPCSQQDPLMPPKCGRLLLPLPPKSHHACRALHRSFWLQFWPWCNWHKQWHFMRKEGCMDTLQESVGPVHEEACLNLSVVTYLIPLSCCSGAMLMPSRGWQLRSHAYGQSGMQLVWGQPVPARLILAARVNHLERFGRELNETAAPLIPRPRTVIQDAESDLKASPFTPALKPRISRWTNFNHLNSALRR